MIGQCTNCSRYRQVIVYANRHGDRWCQACLAAYLARRRIEAGLDPVVEGRLVPLAKGVTVRLDGRLPERVKILGVWYEVCIPAIGNGHGKKVERE